MPVSKSILVKGFVHGVSYRKQTKLVASQLGVNGWVRNLSDGSVEACLEGDERAVEAVIAWCAIGPKKAKVDEIRILNTTYGGKFSDFSIWKDRKAA